MKDFKATVAVILAAVIVLTLAACSAKKNEREANGEVVTAVVTNENGEPVTNSDGSVVTEIVSASDDENESATEVNLHDEGKTPKTTAAQNGKEKETKENKESKNNSSSQNGTASSTTQAVTKVKNPNTVDKIKVSDVTESSMTLSWKAVTCDFYELEYKRKAAEKWETVDDSLKSSKIQLTGLESLTEYSFRLRAVIKHKAGNSESLWTYADAKTAAKVITRKIKIKVLLPARNNEKDKLVLYIKEKDKEKEKLVAEDVVFDGGSFEFETEDKYSGTVTITAKLKNAGAERKLETDKEECTIDISQIGIDIIYDDDE